MNRMTLCKKIAWAIMENDSTNRPIRNFTKELIPGKIWMAINFDNRIPDLLLVGADRITGEQFGFEDFIWIFNKWCNQTGPFWEMDWDTDQDAWSLLFTMDLYHRWETIEDFYTVDDPTNEIQEFPKWITEPGDNTVWAMVANSRITTPNPQQSHY